LADSRTLTIPLGAGVFAFTVLEIVDPYYAEGETVKVRYVVRNNGNVAAIAKIVVTDADTGSAITTYTTSLVPAGEAYGTVEPHATVGAMPNKEWKVKFDLTP